MARIIVVIISVVVFLTGPAFAAEPLHDTPPISQPSWTGLYVGGHLGYGWDRAIWTSISSPSPVVDYSQGSRITSHPISGVFGGGHLRFQLSIWVVGFRYRTRIFRWPFSRWVEKQYRVGRR